VGTTTVYTYELRSDRNVQGYSASASVLRMRLPTMHESYKLVTVPMLTVLKSMQAVSNFHIRPASSNINMTPVARQRHHAPTVMDSTSSDMYVCVGAAQACI
jgi:hypothetical protein